MGNRTLQLPKDYKPNFEFPNIIVTLNDDTPSYGQRPTVSQKIPGFNLDQIPVLYNQTNLQVLLVQEEMVNIPISCTVNCESQFQAKEVAALVKRWLPVNKFISFLEFTSYLEVSPEYLASNLFDPAIHLISNLYTKLNKRTGEIDYCYSLQYEPFIRLDSITTSISDSSQRSFQVVVDITYMAQQPLYMFNDLTPGLAETINIVINPSFGFEPVNEYPSGKLINQLTNDVTNLKKGFVRRNYMLFENDPVERILSLDEVYLLSTQVTEISGGGYRIIATKGADDYLYITVGASEKKYKINMITLPVFGLNYDICTGLVIRPLPTGTTITLNDDEYLNILTDLAGTIVVELCKITKGLTIKFNPTEFLLTEEYSYNLVKGSNILKDYHDYTLSIADNSITFNFSNSQFPLYEPSLTSPLMIQFYLENVTYLPNVGVQPKIGLVKTFNIDQTTAEITWTSDVQTTTQVEYAEESIVYNTSSKLNSNFTFKHHILLTGLNSELNYHFRIKTISIEGEEYISEDYTFRTSA